MARRPRLYLPNCPLHIIQRGNNRDACFRDDSDYKAYLHFMREAAERYGVSIHFCTYEFGVRSKINLLLSNRDVCSLNTQCHHEPLPL
jgi:hypothetical protein